MQDPLFTVVVPVYNGAAYLPPLIESVLSQTYENLELLLVDDASPDNTEEVVRSYSDPRVRYIRLEENGGSDVARRAGLAESSGELVACIDQDDLIHPERLEAHVELHRRHPDTGISYNSRFEMTYDGEGIASVWEPPASLKMEDLVLGYPLAPSDVVMRRDWSFRDELWDDSFVRHGTEVISNGGEIVFFGRAMLAGCRFRGIERVLNYRRYHRLRRLSDLDLRCQCEIHCQEIILDDPRWPSAPDPALARSAFTNTYLVWACYALEQQEDELAEQYLRAARDQTPGLLDGLPSQLLENLLRFASADESRDHGAILRDYASRLPADLTPAPEAIDWAIARGFLARGALALVWDRARQGDVWMRAALDAGAVVDEQFVEWVVHQLFNCHRAVGEERALSAVERCANWFERFGSVHRRRIVGRYHVNRLFRREPGASASSGLSCFARAVANEPRWLWDRGALSSVGRSLLGVGTSEARSAR